MTTQEFVIKESKNFADVEIGDRAKFISPRSVDEWDTSAEGFKNGLTKGLEIAKEFAEWLPDNRWRHTIAKAISQTTAELLSIYLTEINEKK